MQHTVRYIQHKTQRSWVQLWALAVLAFSLLFTVSASAKGRLENLPDFTQIVEQTENAVVNIRTTETVPVRSGHGFGDDPYDFFRWFFGPVAPPDGPHHQPLQGGGEPGVPRGVAPGLVMPKVGISWRTNTVSPDAKALL